MKNYDPFRQLKYKAFDESETTMVTIAEFLILQFSNKGVNNTKLKTLFSQMLKVCIADIFLFLLEYFGVCIIHLLYL